MFPGAWVEEEMEKEKKKEASTQGRKEGREEEVFHGGKQGPEHEKNDNSNS